MRYGLLLLLLLGLPSLAAAEIYQSMDNNGIMHFSDTPLPGSKPVNLAEDSLTGDNDNPPPPAAAPAAVEDVDTAMKSGSMDDVKKAMSKTKADSDTAKAPAAETKSAKPSGGPYKSLTILLPKNEASYFNNSGEMDLNIDVKPNLRDQDKVVVMIDGKAFQTKRDGLFLRVTDIERGKHTAEVQIQDQSGQVLMVSSSVTFYMHRASVNSPTRTTPATPLTPAIQSLNPPPAQPLRPAR